MIYDFDAIGTKWHIDIYDKLDESAGEKIRSNIMKRIDLFDQTYSRFRQDSLVTKMSREKGTFTLPPDAERMLSLYRELYLTTDGLFTPLIGGLISDAGYDAEYSLKQKKKLEKPPTWDEAMDYRHPDLMIKKPSLLDFGAAGKGYLVDLVGKVLEENGVKGYCIDAGGDILHKGKKPIRIGLENPMDANQVIGISMLGDGSICGSAGNRRKWKNFTHIINPMTLTSPTDIIAVWVAAGTALLADALASCLFFVPVSALAAYKFEYVLIHSDGSFEKSPGFQGEIFA
ncbi:MAG: FAD:protein FMN transferase [Candidatus Pacebacteria bacterium]|nr:FAD:protein FMN transferase [Candidatus Paceibacterota bacterium]